MEFRKVFSRNVVILTFYLIFSTKLCASVTKEETKFKEQFAIEGSSFKMKCTGPPGGNLSETHYVVWAINGLPPLRGQKYKILTDGLVIRNVTKEDTLMNYTCSALDRVAFIPVYSENIKLKLRQREGKLLAEPRSFVSTIVGEKVKVYGILRQSKTLFCRMYSRPSPVFTWKNVKTGGKIENDTKLYKIEDDETSSNLTIFIENESLFGEYSCRASNNLGESTQIFILSEGYKPKYPFMFPTFIGKDRVTLRVEPQEEGYKKINAEASKERLPVTNYMVQYATLESLRGAQSRKKWNSISRTINADGDTPFLAKSQGGAGEIFEMLGLQENTTYFVRAAVQNAAAISNFSPAIRVTTDIASEQSLRRPVYVKKDKVSKHEPNKESTNREEHARSTGPTGPNPDAEEISVDIPDCKQPKYRKTVITTTISTTLYENMIDLDDQKASGKSNSSLVKKRVEEDTKVDRINVCSIK